MIKLFCFFFFLTSLAYSQEAMMIQALDIIKNTFQVGYAPADWKKERNGWNVDYEIDQAKEKVRGKNLSLKEFHQVLKEFFNTTHDYHSGITFFSTEQAYLPFSVKGVQGRYFISSIDSQDDHFPFNMGDELISFDGMPTHEKILEICYREYGLGNNEKTDLSLSEQFLTSRYGAFGHVVPKGDIDLHVRSKLTAELTHHTLSWIYFPEKIIPKKLSSKPKRIQGPLLLYPRYKTIRAKLSEDDDDRINEKEKMGFLPLLGKELWSEKFKFFHAYIFESPSKKAIGYIRIPTFLGSDEEAEEFGEIINIFEDNTDALVIDQLDNPGGYLFYLYAIVSMLTDKPIQTLKEKIVITQKEVMEAIDFLVLFDEIKTDSDAKIAYGNSLDGMDVNKALLDSFRSYFAYVVSQWESGNTGMLPCYFFGIDQILPSERYRYTKPILILTNELDFSCADLFPALMQDNMRATILGSQTAGAGGTRMATRFPNLLGIESYYYSGSIAERKDLTPLENLGVTPDILLNVTENDLQNNYPDYVRKILETVEMIVK